ncbi:MAG: hypothetical protein IPI35_22045 [Deltaproteobacteria bacterium]|nr:hypothetical protein [Deltaproteobacteria bacterium]
MDRNPYAPPAADRGEVKPPPEPEMEGGMTLAEAEALRRAYLTHEARLQAVGTLMLPCAVNVVVGPLTGLVGVVALLAVDMEPAPAPVLARLMIVMVGLLLTAFGVMSSVGGLGLWRLDPKHRTLNTVVATVWLVTFWCFCPLGLWALYLLRSSAGAVVLSPEYAEARRRTPHIRFNSHRETFRALALLVLGVTLVSLRAWLG